MGRYDITPERIKFAQELRDLGWQDMSIAVALHKLGWPVEKAIALLSAA